MSEETNAEILRVNSNAMIGRLIVFDGLRDAIRDGRSVRAFLRQMLRMHRNEPGAMRAACVAEARAQAKAMGIRL